MSLIINPYRFGSGGPPGSLYDAISEDGPVMWWRHAEASGSTMLAEAGANGTYAGTPTLGEPAIYTGGETCVLTGASAYGSFSGSEVTLTALTVMTVVKFPAGAFPSFRALVSNDDGSIRRWQQRMSGNKFEFVKIEGGVGTVAGSTSLEADTAYILMTTVSSTGVVTLYVNGVQDAVSSALGAANYGRSGVIIQIGYSDGAGGAPANSHFSESAIFDKELSSARALAYAQAAGFA